MGMNKHLTPQNRTPNARVKRNRMLSLRGLSAWVGSALGALLLAFAVLLLAFGDAILNRYGKGRAERAFAQAHPGYALRIGKLDYSVAANRLVAHSVTLSGTNTMLKVDRITLWGVRWVQFLRGTAAPADVLAEASLDATNLVLEFPREHYGIRCQRLQGSVPASELIAEHTELRPLAGDQAFFAGTMFRRRGFM